MSEGSEWADLIESWAEASNKKLEFVDRSIKIQISTAVIQRTPVGNPNLWVYKHPTRGFIDYISWFGSAPDGYVGGRARNNWFASVSVPSSSVTDKPDKTGKGVLQIAKAKAKESVGGVFYLTNNLPYIRRLEYEGWSTQAPAGMVRVTLREVKNHLMRAVIEARSIK
jgi:hypothetical protein